MRLAGASNCCCVRGTCSSCALVPSNCMPLCTQSQGVRADVAGLAFQHPTCRLQLQSKTTFKLHWAQLICRSGLLCSVHHCNHNITMHDVAAFIFPFRACYKPWCRPALVQKYVVCQVRCKAATMHSLQHTATLTSATTPCYCDIKCTSKGVQANPASCCPMAQQGNHFATTS